MSKIRRYYGPMRPHAEPLPEIRARRELLRRQEEESVPTAADRERMAWANEELRKGHEKRAMQLESLARGFGPLSYREQDLAKEFIHAGLMRGSPAYPGLTPEGTLYVARHRATHHRKTR